MESAYQARGRDTIETAIAHEAADDCTILLLDERLIVLLRIGARARDFELLFAAPWQDDIVYDDAVVVESTPRRARTRGTGSVRG
ncbi:hypothetical protein FXB40_11415 [Bradyrhizobium rifense]|uniref:Uncharacterized protein n=1 Tax=Bradyrhizobium rifense TaxID=515499 RepID=A0A5D3KKQ4_9BRAD|nr:hypothetical protein [Bradyrhizobium rifense]TYL96643.1 hypothetical protein FXB40_11415 [Bradyrhizobium rifense]